MVVAYPFNPSTEEVEAGGSLEFKDNLVYRERSKMTRATQKNPVSKNQRKSFNLDFN